MSYLEVQERFAGMSKSIAPKAELVIPISRWAADRLSVRKVARDEVMGIVLNRHYLHRRAPVSFAFGLYLDDRLVGVCTVGVPPSRHLQKGACPSDPNMVLELNRLWVSPKLGRNAESWFLKRALRQMPPRIVVSYADTAWGHLGYVYRASNWNYAGWTDMERKTPRYDYIVPGKHTRDAFRGGAGRKSKRVQRKPKHKYWIVTGTRRDKKRLERLCGWPKLSWKLRPVETK